MVADVRPQEPEHGKRSRLGCDREAALGHQTGQAHRFQGDGLAPGIRPRDDQNAIKRVDLDGNRHATSPLRGEPEVEERMTHRVESKRPGRPKVGPAAFDVPREQRPRLQRVGAGEPGDRGDDLVAAGAVALRPSAHHPRLLGGFLLGQADQVVVERDGCDRLDEKRLPGGRGRVHNPFDRTRTVRADRDHEAAVTLRHEIVTDERGRRGVVDERFELTTQTLAGFSDRRAYAAKLRRGAVFDLSIGSHVVGDLAGQGRQVGDRPAEALQRVETLRLDSREPLPEKGRIEQRAREIPQRQRVHQHPFEGKPCQGRLRIAYTARKEPAET